MQTWKTELQLSAISDLSDDCPWVTLRDSESSDRDIAVTLFRKAQSEHEWPVRFVECVSLDGGGPTAYKYENPEE